MISNILEKFMCRLISQVSYCTAVCVSIAIKGNCSLSFALQFCYCVYLARLLAFKDWLLNMNAKAHHNFMRFSSVHFFAGEDDKNKTNEGGEEEMFLSSSIAIALSVFILLSSLVLLLSKKSKVTFSFGSDFPILPLEM